ncbi:MAG: hypothetical protein H0U27_03175 [Nitrosopumilus sp.]|nr:hypothetical protein [Nitrosopumilus sp.]
MRIRVALIVHKDIGRKALASSVGCPAILARAYTLRALASQSSVNPPPFNELNDVHLAEKWKP